MPILSVIFGDSGVSFLFLDSLSNYKAHNFPYIYSRDLFGGQYSESAFYSEMFNIVCKTLKKDLNSYQVLIGGYPEPPRIEINRVFELPLSSFIHYGAIYHSVLINNTSLVSPSRCFSAFPVKYLNDSLVDETYEHVRTNYFANMSAFPMYKSNSKEDPALLIEKDNIFRLLDVSPKHPDMEKDKSILFSGERFLNIELDNAKSVEFCLDLIKKPGVFQIKLDTQNLYSAMALAQAYDQSYETLILEAEFTNLCTLINAPGASEFLVYTGNSENKYMELLPDALYFLPASEKTQLAVKMKNGVLGTVERYIQGGALGLIVDTRDKSNEKTFTSHYVSKNIKEWISVIDKNICMRRF